MVARLGTAIKDRNSSRHRMFPPSAFEKGICISAHERPRKWPIKFSARLIFGPSRPFLSSRRRPSVDDQTIALTPALAAWDSFAQPRCSTGIARGRVIFHPYLIFHSGHPHRPERVLLISRCPYHLCCDNKLILAPGVGRLANCLSSAIARSIASIAFWIRTTDSSKSSR
jgi:hypothetical protein